MQKSRGTTSRDRTQSYISLVIDPQANYSTVVTKAAQLLRLDHGKCSLFHVNGCKIPAHAIEDNDGTHPWSIGRYLRSVYSKTTSFKLGLLCEDESSEVC